MKSSALESLLVLSLGVAACFAEPGQSSTGTNASSTGVDTDADDSSGGGPSTSAPTASASSTEPVDPDTTDGTTTAETSDTGSSGTQGPADTGTADTGTTGEPVLLCPSFVDAFDGPMDPVWSLVWEGAIEQVGGQSVFTITAAANDQYPRRVLPWATLGASGAVTFRVQPATLPTQVGTQLNTILEGPDSYDVTLSLNRPGGGLQYRLTSRADGNATVHFEGNASFPDSGWVQFEVDAGQAVVSILDSGGAVMTSFDPVDIPFDLSDAKVGFAATNWGELQADTELAVETFELECAE
jgi:hypothetical protein